VRPAPLPEDRIKGKILDSGTNKIGAVILPVLPEPFPPLFASDWGQDEYGLWMGIEYRGIRQGMRWISPGEFLMGSPEGEPERDDDEHQHKVVLTQGFWLADTACTQDLWQAVTGKNTSRFQGKGLPVDSVSWDDCREFLERLNTIVPGLDAVLPTEAQWEYGCRNSREIISGKYQPFSFGDNITPDLVNYDGDSPYQDGKKGKNREKTVPVGSLPPNDRGLYEMHGNLWEWCRDWYGDYSTDHYVDPAGPEDGSLRVLRGGSWIGSGRVARSACRGRIIPDYRSLIHNIGFRFARGQSGKG